MTIQVQLQTSIDGIIKELSNMELRLRNNASEFLDEAGKIIEKNIQKELRSPNKTGVEKSGRTRFRTAFSSRRSARGESLATDTGVLETLISSSRISPNTVAVGFLENNQGYNYAALHEVKNDRPTLEKAYQASEAELNNLLDKKAKI